MSLPARAGDFMAFRCAFITGRGDCHGDVGSFKNRYSSFWKYCSSSYGRGIGFSTPDTVCGNRRSAVGCM